LRLYRRGSGIAVVFFNSSIAKTGGDEIASEAVKNHIKQIVAGEPTDNPYSDQKIVELLKAQGQDEELKNIVGLRIRAMREHLDSALGPAKQLTL